MYSDWSYHFYGILGVYFVEMTIFFKVRYIYSETDSINYYSVLEKDIYSFNFRWKRGI